MEHYNERTISVTREKIMYGCANDYWIIIDEERYAKLSCGKTVEIKLDSNIHKMYIAPCDEPHIKSNRIIIPADEIDHRYFLVLKLHFFRDGELILSEM